MAEEEENEWITLLGCRSPLALLLIGDTSTSLHNLQVACKKKRKKKKKKKEEEEEKEEEKEEEEEEEEEEKLYMSRHPYEIYPMYGHDHSAGWSAKHTN